MESVLQWIVEYGYMALFCILMFGIIGAPFPDDLILTFTGIWSLRVISSHIPAVAFDFWVAYVVSR